MMKKEVYVIGVMSGTSLDGVDLVYVKFNRLMYNEFEIICAETLAYNEFWKSNLRKAINFNEEEINKLDIDYGILLGEIINDFVEKFSIDTIDFIASHGHTILHQPEKGITLQIGSGKEISKTTGHKVVCDFRTQDVKFGGQGAPLVPVGDELLFSNYDCCLNLGGFSNVSFKEEGVRIAFDICPVNIVLNFYVNKLGLEYDDSGVIASKGKLNQVLLEKLNGLNFYEQNHPKSLGLEWVQEDVFPLIDSCENKIENILRTFVEHIAIQIGKTILMHNSVLITGGGVFNLFLMKRIEFYSKKELLIVDPKLINFKEALIFAFLGLLRVDNQVNCLASVTGSKKDHSSGVIFKSM